MGKQQSIDEQANISVQGADGAAETPKVEQKPIEQPAELITAVDPDWVQTILDSNAAVVESNDKVLAGLDSFKQHASEFVEQIVEKASSGIGSATGTPIITKSVDKEIDEDASYVVAEGKSFADKDNISIKYLEGQDVTNLGADRLKGLLNQGLIEEA